MSRLSRPALWIAVLLGLAAASRAPARELHWSAVDVRARLDSSGALHVVERQAMVFTGDWNGGERVFRLFPGQSLSLDGITRIGPDGARQALAAGDLSAVDRYAWTNSRTLRWRSRLPSDPPFEDTEIVYEIAYTLSGILLREGDRYVLDHDFLFPERSGAVEKFTLELSLESPWRPARPFEGSLSRGPLAPGQGVVLRVPLLWQAAGHPAGVRAVAGPTMRLALFVLLVAAAIALYLAFRAREVLLGRYAPPARGGDRRRVARRESLLARAGGGGSPLGREDRLARGRRRARAAGRGEEDRNARRGKEAVPVPPRPGREPLRIRPGPRCEASSSAAGRKPIPTRSASTTPPPGSTPRRRSAAGSRRSSRAARSSRTPRRPSPGGRRRCSSCSGAAALVWSVVAFHEEPGRAIGIGIASLVLWGVGGGLALLYRSRADKPEGFAAVFLWVPLAVVLFAWLGYRAPQPATVPFVVGVFLLRLAILAGVFAVAKTREGPKRIARRKTLAAARAYFERELAQPAPALRDDWFPWIVALGLTHDADRWSRVHGPAAATAGSGSRSGSGSGSSSSSASSSPSSSWTGGGGAFGGAGASASWGLAAGALASGVSAPSSSGGGGGGGGGGSSGGGGGGGW